MIKKLIPLFILIPFLFSTSYLTFAADNPQAAIANSKVKFQQMNENILNTNKKISSLNIQVAKLNTDINKNNIDITKNNKLLQTEKSHMEQLIKEINSTQDLANKRLRAMYINGYDENFIAVLLTSESLSDFFYKYDAIKSIISFDKKIFNDLAEKKKALSENIADMNDKSQQLQQLKNTNAENLKQLNENKKNLEALILQFNKEKNSALQIIKDNEEKLIAHSISVIDSKSSTINDMKNALETLNSLAPQITTDSVRKKAKDYINTGNNKLTILLAENTNQVVSGSDTYKATFAMTATAYTGGTFTALGLKPVRDPANLSTIAVDPSVIPLGTKVYIPGYGNAICSDTGSSIKGNIIDLYMNSEAECFSFGRKSVTLYIIAYPGEW